MSLYVIMPAYNEEDNIDKLVEEWHQVTTCVPESILYIVDDGSRDGTYTVLKELVESGKFPNLRIDTKKNSGHGPTCLYAYSRAMEKGATYIFQTDSDRQTLPEEFWSFWEKREEYSMVIGDRVNREDGMARRMVSKSICLILLLIFRVNVPDPNTPFRLMRADKLKKFLPLMKEDYNLPNVMLTVFFSYYGEKICWEKITFLERQGGVNSINYGKILRIGAVAVIDFLRQYRKMDCAQTSQIPSQVVI